jgi:hypothetical protein
MLGLSLPRAWKSVFFMPACGAGVPLYCVLFERAFQTDGYVAAIKARITPCRYFKFQELAQVRAAQARRVQIR